MWSTHHHHGFAPHLPYMCRNMKIHSQSSFDNSQIESLRGAVTSILLVAVLLPLPQNCSNIRSEDTHIMTWSWVPVILVIQSQQWRIIENVSQQDKKGGKSELKEHDGSGRVQSDKNFPLKVKFHNKKCFHTTCWPNKTCLISNSHFSLSPYKIYPLFPFCSFDWPKSLQHSHM